MLRICLRSSRLSPWHTIEMEKTRGVRTPALYVKGLPLPTAKVSARYTASVEQCQVQRKAQKLTGRCTAQIFWFPFSNPLCVRVCTHAKWCTLNSADLNSSNWGQQDEGSNSSAQKHHCLGRLVNSYPPDVETWKYSRDRQMLIKTGTFDADLSSSRIHFRDGPTDECR